MLQPSLVDLDLAKPTSEPARAFRPKKTFRLGTWKVGSQRNQEIFCSSLGDSEHDGEHGKKEQGSAEETCVRLTYTFSYYIHSTSYCHQQLVRAGLPKENKCLKQQDKHRRTLPAICHFAVSGLVYCILSNADYRPPTLVPLSPLVHLPCPLHVHLPFTNTPRGQGLKGVLFVIDCSDLHVFSPWHWVDYSPCGNHTCVPGGSPRQHAAWKKWVYYHGGARWWISCSLVEGW